MYGVVRTAGLVHLASKLSLGVTLLGLRYGSLTNLDDKWQT